MGFCGLAADLRKPGPSPGNAADPTALSPALLQEDLPVGPVCAKLESKEAVG